MISPLIPGIQASDGGGKLSALLYRWLLQLQTAVRGPFVGVQAPGTFTVPPGENAIQVKRLALSGNQRAVLLGESRLVICG